MRLLTLPLALVRLPLRAAASAVSMAQGLIRPAPPASAATTPAPPPRFVRQPPTERTPAERTPAERKPAAANGGAPPAAESPAPEPVHVSEEPTLVAESAERGAEEGAGAEVHVDEPWSGYRAMTAAEITKRLRTASPAVAAAVSLYEAGGKGRTSVLEAAARRTRAQPA
jgi:hypothetical protein